MSVKGTTQELFIKRQEIHIITFWGNKIIFKYTDLKMIEYYFASRPKSGNLTFIKKLNNERISFNFPISSNELIVRVISYIKENHPEITLTELISKDNNRANGVSLNFMDPRSLEAAKIIVNRNKVSAGMLQRIFNIDFEHASTILDELCRAGIIGEENYPRKRKILVSKKGLEELINNTTSYLPYNEALDSMTGNQFEYFCAHILRKNDFMNVLVTQEGGDHGIDVIAEKNGISYAIQCKCYSGNVGNSAVQQAHTGKSIYQKDIAVVLTNSHFTKQAIEEAKILGVKLWDRTELMGLVELSVK